MYRSVAIPFTDQEKEYDDYRGQSNNSSAIGPDLSLAGDLFEDIKGLESLAHLTLLETKSSCWPVPAQSGLWKKGRVQVKPPFNNNSAGSTSNTRRDVDATKRDARASKSVDVLVAVDECMDLFSEIYRSAHTQLVAL